MTAARTGMPQPIPHPGSGVPAPGLRLNAAGRRAALILAGGRSSRLGRDKSLEPLAGRPLAAHVAERVAGGARALVVGGSHALGALLGVSVLDDLEGAGAGPLRGVAAGLDWAAREGASFLLTAPCDTPFLPEDFGEVLEGALGSRSVLAAAAGRRHPLCALWSVSLAPEVRREAARTRHARLEDLIVDLGGAYHRFPDEAAFLNVNTEEDLAEARARGVA